MEALNTSERRERLDQFRNIFENDPDPGMHAAAEWLLRQWRENDNVTATQQKWAEDDARPVSPGATTPRWYVNTQGQTMVLLPGPIECQLGSPITDAEREGGPRSKVEHKHSKTIKRTFAIAAKEVTVAQFLRFNARHPYREDLSPTPDSPMNRVSWYQAAEYCNWLSAQEKIPQNHWCYLPNSAGRYGDGMTMRDNYLTLQGYRLPTEAEWEYACRAGASTSRYFGNTKSLLPAFAWYTENSRDQATLPTGSKLPNDFGLFDTLGNVLEWCQNRGVLFVDGEDTEEDGPISNDVSHVLRGGSYNDHPQYVRCTHRFPFPPTLLEHSAGFRVARTVR